MAVIEFTTGEPGAGKSYRRCAHFIVRELLNPNEPTQNGILCNYPIKFDPWVDKHGIEQAGLCQVANDLYGLEEWEVRDRVKVFPPDEVESWIPSGGRKAPIRGPWDYLYENDIDVAGWHIAIDEIHNFAPKGKTNVGEEWGRWLGEIRHEGCTIEFLTQDPDEVTRVIKGRAGVRRQLVPSKERRDFAFKIKLDDWYQLSTVWGSPYRPSVWQVEQRKVMSKWVTSDEKPFWFNPDLFGVYDSHSASNSTGRSGAQADPAYKRFSRLGLLMWFMRRNGYRFIFNAMVPRVLFIVLIVVGSLNFGRIMRWVGSIDGGSSTTASEVDQANNDFDAGGGGSSPDWLAYQLSVQNFEARIDRVLAELDRVDGIDRLVAVTPTHAFFASGRRVTVGEKITRPDGDIVSVWMIDYENRQIVFSDGDSVRVGSDFGMLEKVSTASAAASELRESLQVRPNEPEGEPRRQGVRR